MMLLAGAVLGSGPGCDDADPAGDASKPDTRPNTGIASLSPALTSIVLGLGGEDQLVAVSNYDTDPRVADLPRVGDYLNVDWEKLADLRPETLLVQQEDEALARRALSDLDIVTYAIPIDRLADIKRAVLQISTLVAGDTTATRVAGRWLNRLERLETEHPADSVTTLLVCGDRSLCAGGGNYLDELLTLAGGKNVLNAEGYIEPDDEQVAELAPAVIVVLLPEGDADAVRQRWERFGRVEIIERPDALTPGWTVLEIAEEMKRQLHGNAPKPRDESANPRVSVPGEIRGIALLIPRLRERGHSSLSGNVIPTDGLR